MSASGEVSGPARDFVQAIEGYFGPWRGQTAKDEIAKWLTGKGIERPLLRKVYLRMRDTRKVEPTNTISIVDVWDEIDRLNDARKPLALEAPDYIQDQERAEVAACFRKLTADLCDDTRRSELLRQREDR